MFSKLIFGYFNELESRMFEHIQICSVSSNMINGIKFLIQTFYEKLARCFFVVEVMEYSTFSCYFKRLLWDAQNAIFGFLMVLYFHVYT